MGARRCTLVRYFILTFNLHIGVRCRNKFDVSCDEDDIYEATEDESASDVREGDELDYTTDVSFRAMALTKEKREQLYNLV
nr:hypothetical protein HmN_000977400 [Hymenolepis microstoma]